METTQRWSEKIAWCQRSANSSLIWGKKDENCSTKTEKLKKRWKSWVQTKQMMVLRIHTRQTLTLSGNLGSPITLMCMFLDVGANVKGLVTNTGKTCKHHKKKKTKPEATVLVIAPPPHSAWITILININEWKKHFYKSAFIILSHENNKGWDKKHY